MMSSSGFGSASVGCSTSARFELVVAFVPVVLESVGLEGVQPTTTQHNNQARQNFCIVNAARKKKLNHANAAHYFSCPFA
jgi:hypothetical protein